jgi:hypothetical protein
MRRGRSTPVASIRRTAQIAHQHFAFGTRRVSLNETEVGALNRSLRTAREQPVTVSSRSSTGERNELDGHVGERTQLAWLSGTGQLESQGMKSEALVSTQVRRGISRRQRCAAHRHAMAAGIRGPIPFCRRKRNNKWGIALNSRSRLRSVHAALTTVLSRWAACDGPRGAPVRAARQVAERRCRHAWGR